MSDLISRADAIEAVCRTRCGDKAKGCPAHSCLVIEEFDAIPSAELPKGDLISRADVLKYPIRLDHYDEVNGDRVFVYGVESVIEYVESLPSADAEFADLPDIPRAYYEKIVGNMAHEINMLKEQLESADAVHGFRGGKIPPKEMLDGTVLIPKHQWLEMERELAELKEKFESADAVHGWRIGKPTEQGKYMVTLDSFGHKHIDLFYYGKPMMPNRKVRGKCWYRDDDEWGDVVYDDTDIIAWMPLPKPYKGGDDNADTD